MSAEIYFKDDKHISATDAAALAGLSRDYIARLCRQGKVVGHQVGKNWYVSERSFTEFLKSQDTAKAQRREQLVQQRQIEYATAHVAPKAPSKTITHEHFVRDNAYRVQTLARHASEMQSRMAAAVAIQGERMFKHASDATTTPFGVSDAVMRAAHVPTYVISPFVEFMHKLTAFAIAFALTFGTYAIVDQRAAKFAIASFKDTERKIVASYRAFTVGGTAAFVSRAERNLAAAAENPGDVFADAALSVGRAIPEFGKQLALLVYSGVNDALYSVAFPGDLVRSLGFTVFDSDSSVELQIAPYARGVQKTISSVFTAATSSVSGGTASVAAPRTQTATVSNVTHVSYVVAAAGGLTRELLDERLIDVENRLSSRIASLSSSNSTAIMQTYQVLGQATRIDRLDNTAIHNAVITGGSMSGIALNTSDLSGTVAIANGGTGTSTAPTFGQVLLGNSSGSYDLVATSSLGITSGTSSQWTTNGTSVYYNDGSVGLGTTTPWGKLALSLNSGESYRGNNAFIISSSTASATTTLFSVSNAGQTFASVGSSGAPGYSFQANPTVGFFFSGGSLSMTNGSDSVGLVSSLFGNSNSNRAALYTGALSTTQPGFTRQDDTNTGLGLLGSDLLTFITGGIERARIDASGNFGIGSTTFSNNKFVVGGNTFLGGNVTATGTLRTAGITTIGTGESSTNSLLQFSAGTDLGGLWTIDVGSNAIGWTLRDSTDGFNALQVATDGAITIGPGSLGNSIYKSSGGLVGIGVTNPLNQLDVRGAAVIGASYASNNTAPTNGLLVQGNVGIGTSVPFSRLHVLSGSATTGSAFEITNSASTTILSISNAGLLSVGAAQGTGTMTNIFTIDASSSTTTISNLSIGNLNFDTDAGVVALSNIPLSSSPAAGTIASQSILIGDTAVLTVYGENDGASSAPQNTRVLIGTSTIPYARLSVAGAGTGTSQLAEFFNGASTTVFRILDNGTAYFSGNVGVGTTTPFAKFAIHARSGETNTKVFEVASSTNAATSSLFYVDNVGNIAAPTTLVSCGGIQTNGNGVMSCTSDSRLKDVLAPFDAGLDAILRVTPQTYAWKEGTMFYDGGVHYSGFIAQNIEEAIPDAVSETKTGFLQINTTSILAATINAVKEIGTIAGTFKNGLVAWLADSANGISTIFADTLSSRRLCVGEPGNVTCITKAQLDAMLAGQTASAAPPTDSDGSSGEEDAPQGAAPSIEIDGENPAHILIGAQYADLGARITGPTQADTNLGIHTFLDGLAVDALSLDTSTTTTYIIEYVATNEYGTSTSTRTVYVEQEAPAAE